MLWHRPNPTSSELRKKIQMSEFRKMPQQSSVALREHIMYRNKKKILTKSTPAGYISVQPGHIIHSALFHYILMGLLAPGKHFLTWHKVVVISRKYSMYWKEQMASGSQWEDSKARATIYIYMPKICGCLESWENELRCCRLSGSHN